MSDSLPGMPQSAWYSTSVAVAQFESDTIRFFRALITTATVKDIMPGRATRDEPAMSDVVVVNNNRLRPAGTRWDPLGLAQRPTSLAYI